LGLPDGSRRPAPRQSAGHDRRGRTGARARQRPAAVQGRVLDRERRLPDPQRDGLRGRPRPAVKRLALAVALSLPAFVRADGLVCEKDERGRDYDYRKVELTPDGVGGFDLTLTIVPGGLGPNEPSVAPYLKG